MKYLSLLRHAKSGWDDPVARDFDRALNDRGHRASAAIGRYARSIGLRCESIIASPAVRVIETLDTFLPEAGLDALEPHWDRRIYLASSVSLLDCLRDVPDDVNHVLMAGHNPGLEDLILELVPDDPADTLRRMVEDKFPTAALAVMALGIDTWRDIDARTATLTDVKRPRDLDPALGPDDD
jgi:phosphohistidine phosphatase